MTEPTGGGMTPADVRQAIVAAMSCIAQGAPPDGTLALLDRVQIALATGTARVPVQRLVDLMHAAGAAQDAVQSALSALAADGYLDVDWDWPEVEAETPAQAVARLEATDRAVAQVVEEVRGRLTQARLDLAGAIAAQLSPPKP